MHLLTSPSINAWVSASAGTGKTKLLIDRLAHLLLTGVSPSSIVCLTYTRAAAGEMSERLYKLLHAWRILPEEELIAALRALTQKEPTDLELKRARDLERLCAHKPVSIQTLHSFCQTYINKSGRGGRLVDPSELRRIARNLCFEHFKNPSHQAMWQNLAEYMTFDNAEDLLWGLYEKRFAWFGIRSHYSALDAEQVALEKLIPKQPADRQDFKREWATWYDHPWFAELNPHATNWFDFASHPTVQNQFLTQKGEPRKRVPAHSFMDEYQSDIADIYAYNLHASWAASTHVLKVVADAWIQALETHKKHHHILDYHDLLERMMQLLDEDSSMLERLDLNLHHLLVDEAQDTSPEQWAIIRRLVHTFLNEPNRSLFVVGDMKQSIYSFQGADPKLFIGLEDDFKRHIKGPFIQATLDASWRSTRPILDVVDAIFDQHALGVRFADEAHSGHQLTRYDAPGRVQIWPLIDALEAPEMEPWATPAQKPDPIEPLAQDIAQKVKDMLDSGEILASTGRPIAPQDILILLTRRGLLMRCIHDALVEKGVPTSGLDRLNLWQHLATMDWMALGRFVLNQADEWSLVCLLKSPLMRSPMDEDELYELCFERGEESVWGRLQVLFKERSEELFYWVELWRTGMSPSQFFMCVMAETRAQCWAVWGSVLKDLEQAFLDSLIDFEQHTGSSLAAFLCIERTDMIATQMTKNGVRLMTVHGSKGLQSPIVIVADATDPPRPQNDDFVIAHEPPVMALRPTKAHTHLAWLYNQHAGGILAENRRLLYVALTRAADQLYIGGLNRKTSSDSLSSWYTLALHAVENLSDGQMLYEHGVHSYGEPWVRANDKPVLPIEIKPFALLELADDSIEARRGTWVHQFFERRRSVEEAHHFVSTLAEPFVSLEEVLKWQKWMHDSDLSWMWSGDAEVEYVDEYGKIGRIDRLIVGETEVVIIDWKTGAAPDEIPAEYRNQMNRYECFLKVIYPDHAVKAYLVWVDEKGGPKFVL